MSRCFSINDLEVHHKWRDGGNGIENAQVLCHDCHVNTGTYGIEGQSPPEFSTKTKETALEHAGNCCECEKEGCHLSDREISQIIIEAVSKPKYYL